jgi:hypothetical protein
MEFIVDNSSSGTNSNIITGLSDNIVYNSTLLSSSNNLQSNILNTSNYSFNISNILTTRDALNLTASSNYASNISNVLKANIDANNTATNTAITNTSNYASNISNILLASISLGTNTSNYASNISNVLKANIDANNTATNTAIGNTSNYASNISNILTTRDATNLINTSNYSSNISNVLLTNYNSLNTITNTNTSNYSSNISNVLLTNYNSLNTITNTNTSNYSSNISNVLLTNYNSLNTITNTNTSNYASNISNILTTRDETNLINTSNYASNISNVLLTNYNSLNTITNTNTSNYASNISNILKANIDANNTTTNTAIGNTSNYASNISNILTTRDATNLSSSSNYALNISNIIIANNSNFTLGIATNTSNYALNISNIIIARYLPLTAGTLTGTLTAPTINLTTSADGMNPLFIRSAQSGANNCIYIQNNINQNAYIGLGGSTFGGNYTNNLFFESASGSIILNASGRTSSSTPNMIIHSTGNVGIGTNNPQTELELYDSTNPKIFLNHNGTSRYFISGMATSIDIGNDIGTSKTIRFMPDNVERMIINSTGNVGIGTNNPNGTLELYSTTQLTSRIILSGQEFYTNQAIASGGIALLCGVNRTNNRQLWIGDSLLLTSNTTNPVLRICSGTNSYAIDCCATNGLTSLPLLIGSSTSITTIRGSTINLIDNSTGNVGIGTTNPRTRLHIDHSSTTFNAVNGGLYLINSNNVANNCSVIGASIYGSTANKAGLSLNVNGNYGWSMYINGSDTTNKTLRFNSSDDSSGIERLQIRGSDGYTIFTGNMHIGSSTGSGSLIIGNSASATSITLTDISAAVWKIETGNYNLTFSNDSPTPGTFQSKIIITSNANLLVRGDISAFANMSDRRLKHNINDLSINCIDLLNNIKPVEFIWNDMDEIINLKRNTLDHGFIAQDIELLLPNLVNQYEKYKSIKYEKFTPYLVKGSQELYKLIQEQQKKIIDLQKQINMIKSQLS